MGRFVPTATSGDNGHLPIPNLVRIRAAQDLMAREPVAAWVEDSQTLQHLLNDIFAAIDELLHART
jgi:hypothetical protein